MTTASPPVARATVRGSIVQPTGVRQRLIDAAVDLLTIGLGIAVLVVPGAGRPVPSWAVAAAVILVVLGIGYDLAGATVAPVLRFATAARRTSALPLAAITLVPLTLDWRNPTASATLPLVVAGLALRARYRDIRSGRTISIVAGLSALVGLAWMGAAQAMALLTTYRGLSSMWILRDAIPAAAPVLVALAAIAVPVSMWLAGRGAALPISTAAALAVAIAGAGLVPAAGMVDVVGWPLLAAAGALACGKHPGGQRIAPRVAVLLAAVSMIVTTGGLMVVADDRSAPLENWRIAVILAWATLAIVVLAAWSRQDSAPSVVSWLALGALAVARVFSAPQPDIALLVLTATVALLVAGALHRAGPTLAAAIGFGREAAGRSLA